MSYDGFNQEDSLIINENSVFRGLFETIFFTYEEVEIDKNEHVQIPEPKKRNNNYDYSKLDINGVVKVGTVLKENDVMIGIIMKIQDMETSVKKFIDKSRVYKDKEPAQVIQIIEDNNEKGTPFYKIKLKIDRKTIIGDKLTSRSGCKGIVTKLEKYCNLPYSKSGLVPDLLLNVHSIPTRMIIGQILESFITK